MLALMVVPTSLEVVSSWAVSPKPRPFGDRPQTQRDRDVGGAARIDRDAAQHGCLKTLRGNGELIRPGLNVCENENAFCGADSILFDSGCGVQRLNVSVWNRCAAGVLDRPMNTGSSDLGEAHRGNRRKNEGHTDHPR